MDSIKRILAAVDFSVYSSHILEYAAWVAEQTSAEIIAVSVINKRLMESVEKVFNDQHPGMFSRKKYLNDEISRRTKSLDELIKESVPGHIKTSVVIVDGVPFEEIIAAVIHQKADLLVIAPKGRTNLPDRLFGTTSEKVFRHSPIPVLSLNTPHK